MKFSIVAILALFVTSFAFADVTPLISVKINSFYHIGDTNSTLGEVCGLVTVADTDAIAKTANLIPVTVTVDPTTSNPGNYTVLVDRTGNFCAVVNTFTGSAQAEAWLPGGVKTVTEVSHIAPNHR